MNGHQDTITVTTPACPRCSVPSQVIVSRKAFRAWQDGAHIQHVFPPEVRELLKTGYHDACWDLDIPEPEDDEGALICERCGTEFVPEGGIPTAVPPLIVCNACGHDI